MDDDDDLALLLGGTERERLIVRPLGWSHPGASDPWDRGWLKAVIDLQAGAFSGLVEADLRADDFVRFRNSVRRLHDHLDQGATFDTLEGALKIDVSGDGRGHFEARCEVCDRPGDGNVLRFTLVFDQTHLPTLVRALDRIVAAYPG
ncbi:MAG: hypothetical protein KF878_18315 [Planctomycetes bacterium]|nr:hypothetical protein [Planctomycetota bacterium]